MAPRFSIVINTLDRADSLRQTLDSLRWLRYAGEFEVIVVNGPSSDGTQSLLEATPGIRVGRCAQANLSVSRNIGIRMAAGDVVAFLDDDAVPEPEWLAQLAPAYEDPGTGAAGGMVFDHTGRAFQARFCVVDRFGNAEPDADAPSPHLCFPGSWRVPHLMGTNASFRRSALLEVGGFDETYEYFLDETDLCLRLMDAGWLIAQLPGAYVHHKFAPSHLRNQHRIPRHRFPIVKNHVYFSLRHARAHRRLEEVLQEHHAFIERHRADIRWAAGEGLVPASDAGVFDRDVDRALDTGLRMGFAPLRAHAFIQPGDACAGPGDFRPFATTARADGRSLVLVSRDFPPGHGGGIATFMCDLARALARAGHVMHVVTATLDVPRVDFEHGVWMHRIAAPPAAQTPAAQAAAVPQALWDWSAAALAEVERIATHRPVDVVEAPLWDAEGIAFLLDGRWPLVTSLQTSLHVWLETHAAQRDDAQWMAGHGAPLLALERRLMLESQGVRAISAAIWRDLEAAYGLRFDEARTRVAHLGLEDAAQAGLPSQPQPATPSPQAPGPGPADGITVLFVGRLEARKGIDVLLDALPSVLAGRPQVRVRIAGEDTGSHPQGLPWAEALAQRHRQAGWLAQVRFEGRLDEAALLDAYRSADLVVAPSRYESFGLVLVEALRAGKPAIGCAVGGMPEILSDGVDGLLVPPGDADALAQALARLVEDAGLRARLGLRARQTYLDRFTADTMARASEPLYALAARRPAPGESPDGP